MINEINTLALLFIVVVMGFLIYFISSKFLIYIMIITSLIFIIPMFYPFNPFIISIPDLKFIELIINALIYMMISMFVIGLLKRM